MASLLASISGGYDWMDVALPLRLTHVVFEVCYLFFVMFVSFGLLNVLTGIIVENTKDASAFDRKLAIKVQLENNESFTNQLRHIFLGMDDAGTGEMTKDALEIYLTSKEFLAELQALNLTAD